jgi:hypothetical protein
VHELAELHPVGRAVVQPGDAAVEVAQVAVLVDADAAVGGPHPALGHDRLRVVGPVPRPPPAARVDAGHDGQADRGGEPVRALAARVGQDPAQRPGGLGRGERRAVPHRGRIRGEADLGEEPGRRAPALGRRPGEHGPVPRPPGGEHEPAPLGVAQGAGALGGPRRAVQPPGLEHALG